MQLKHPIDSYSDEVLVYLWDAYKDASAELLERAADAETIANDIHACLAERFQAAQKRVENVARRVQAAGVTARTQDAMTGEAKDMSIPFPPGHPAGTVLVSQGDAGPPLPGLMTKCETCGGEGREALGEHFVTREMAMDAGDMTMEGMSMGIEYRTCQACNGSGAITILESPFADDPNSPECKGTSGVHSYEVLRPGPPVHLESCIFCPDRRWRSITEEGEGPWRRDAIPAQAVARRMEADEELEPGEVWDPTDGNVPREITRRQDLRQTRSVDGRHIEPFSY